MNLPLKTPPSNNSNPAMLAAEASPAEVSNQELMDTEASKTVASKTEASKTLRSNCNPTSAARSIGKASKLDVLRRQLQQIETVSRGSHREVISTGCSRLDQQLPAGGLARGTVTEWLLQLPRRLQAEPFAGLGSGAELLSLLAARQACQAGATSPRRTLVIIDPEHCFYPVAANAWGISLRHTVIIRCRQPTQILWAIHQSLQCSAVGAVWARFPLNPTGGRASDLDQRWSRRFQLAAEQHGTMAMFVRRSPRFVPAPIASAPIASKNMVRSRRSPQQAWPQQAWAQQAWAGHCQAGPKCNGTYVP